VEAAGRYSPQSDERVEALCLAEKKQARLQPRLN
jgi:hypothetical protein